MLKSIKVNILEINLSPLSCDSFESISHSFILLNPLANSLLYSFLGKRFRNDLLNVFKFRKGPSGRPSLVPSLSNSSRLSTTRLSSFRYSTGTQQSLRLQNINPQRPAGVSCQQNN